MSPLSSIHVLFCLFCFVCLFDHPLCVSVPPHDVKRMAWNSTGNSSSPNSELSQSSMPAAPLGSNTVAAINNTKQSKNTLTNLSFFLPPDTRTSPLAGCPGLHMLLDQRSAGLMHAHVLGLITLGLLGNQTGAANSENVAEILHHVVAFCLICGFGSPHTLLISILSLKSFSRVFITFVNIKCNAKDKDQLG